VTETAIVCDSSPLYSHRMGRIKIQNLRTQVFVVDWIMGISKLLLPPWSRAGYGPGSIFLLSVMRSEYGFVLFWSNPHQLLRSCRFLNNFNCPEWQNS